MTNNSIGLEQYQLTPIAGFCYVYAKTKWMRQFKAFDLEGFFAGSLINASVVPDKSDTRDKLQRLADNNSSAQWQFQLRQSTNGKIIFETRLAA